MSLDNDVAEYVRAQGLGRDISYVEIADHFGLEKVQVYKVRSNIIRVYDDIWPNAPGMMRYCPDWKTTHPEDWAEIQERSQRTVEWRRGKHKPVKAPGRLSRAGMLYQNPGSKNKLPNVIGPVLTIHNVVAVNVHPDHVAIQHQDGTWTKLKGHLTFVRGNNG